MSIKLLVVEDDLMARIVAKSILTQLGYEFDIAENGEEAMELFKKNKYDFVFMDIGLPGMSGIDATRKLRELEKTGNSVPIVALTAHAEESYKTLGLEAGMQEFVLKPLTKEVAQAIINKYVKKQ
ncbi:response regulator [Rickettsiella endosymbiont of Dermanyssus gallinae]|uniref:response regulator n=1 Tax=Rickettsiella endosymbiont of Dermanyssus gallinae TaxID=2856608 RepID=UPI001C52CE29|nr:response regulator [Rickettsiella endosymbiont of Dermanyssus gallinae]